MSDGPKSGHGSLVGERRLKGVAGIYPLCMLNLLYIIRDKVAALGTVIFIRDAAGIVSRNEDFSLVSGLLPFSRAAFINYGALCLAAGYVLAYCDGYKIMASERPCH